jgi:hypothetical protein
VERDYDTHLLESVAVRRQRLHDALLHGSLRTRRRTNDNLKRAIGGAVLAAVLCAGCVGWAFLSNQLAGRPGGPFTPRTAGPAPPGTLR